MRKPKDGEECAAEFSRRKQAWLWIAIPAAVVLLLSIVTTDVAGGVSLLQIAGLVMLVAFAAASVVLCRCPRCGKLVVDKKELVPGWGLKRCPHCDAPLRQQQRR